MGFLGSLMIAGILAGFVFQYWDERLFAGNRAQIKRWLMDWLGKGLILPVVVWVFVNCGRHPMVPPLVRSVIKSKLAPGSLGWVLAVTAPGVLIIATYWTTVSLAWLFTQLIGRHGQWKEHLVLAGVWTFITVLPVAAVAWAGGWPAAGLAGIVMWWPIVHNAKDLLPDQRPTPVYARAVAKLKFGKYGEAEEAILQELEKFEDDFDGWLMLAGIYANHFHDLPEAERTVLQLVNQPNLLPGQISVALHQLADWHLKAGHDPLAARRVLAEIGRRLPGTHLARMAELRRNQIPDQAPAAGGEAPARTYRLPVTEEVAPATPTVNHPKGDHHAAAAAANALVARLEKDPNDVAVREQLATLLAETLDRPECGIEQLQLLLEMPAAPEGKASQWLARIAEWHIALRLDWDTGRVCLERIVREYPMTKEAFGAMRRLQMRDMDVKLARRKPRALAPKPGATPEPG